MPNIRVNVRRSDCEENDVSASKNHLSELAEERKAETDAVPEEPIAELSAEKPKENDALSESKTGIVSEGGGPESEEGALASESEDAESGALDQPELSKQGSVIKAERTDHASWDARTGLGKAVGGLCCWKASKKDLD